jgi:hypothetical protein
MILRTVKCIALMPSASGQATIVAAGVVIILVAIIAGLDPSVHDPITAARVNAIAAAAVGFDVITVVTFFETGISNLQIVTYNTIAAGRGLAGVETGIIGDAVAVVTGFDPGAHPAVTAAR